MYLSVVMAAMQLGLLAGALRLGGGSQRASFMFAVFSALLHLLIIGDNACPVCFSTFLPLVENFQALPERARNIAILVDFTSYRTHERCATSSNFQNADTRAETIRSKLDD